MAKRMGKSGGAVGSMYSGGGKSGRSMIAPEASGLGNSGAKKAQFNSRFATHAGHAKARVAVSGQVGNIPMHSASPLDLDPNAA